jgi:hypothetical protein
MLSTHKLVAIGAVLAAAASARLGVHPFLAREIDFPAARIKEGKSSRQKPRPNPPRQHNQRFGPIPPQKQDVAIAEPAV